MPLWSIRFVSAEAEDSFEARVTASRFDRCIEGGGTDTLLTCELDSWRTSLRKRIR